LSLASLPPAQQRLWPELFETLQEFTLYGGTAIALRLGHRSSIDFDFFANSPFTPSTLLLKKAKIPLAEMLASAAIIYGHQFSPLLSLKALSYHDDPTLADLSAEIRRDLIAAVKGVDPQHLPVLAPVRRRADTQ
jgi:nucleotidyltransferase AbiEii toxin of type IV toxin-antitoxin system